MKQKEYVTSVVMNNILVNVGLDDCGQQYFIEYNQNGELVEEGCGSYNFDYKGYIEYKFGEPSTCCDVYPCMELPHECTSKDKGYCCKCKYYNTQLWILMKLNDLGVTDRRGTLLEPWDKILHKEG